MSDDCITTARDIIKARLAKDHELLNSELREVKFDYANRGILRSSMYVQKIQSVCKAHLETRAQLIFEIFEQNLIGPGVVSDGLNQKLKAEFLAHFNAHVQMISAVLETAKKGESCFKAMNLEEPSGRLISEYHAKIDWLCRKLGSEANKPQPHIMSIEKQVNISGTSHNIQVGDHNVQEIVSSLTNLQALIDASQATPEQKAEAKSRLQNFLQHPLTISVLGNLAGGLIKTALPGHVKPTP